MSFARQPAPLLALLLICSCGGAGKRPDDKATPGQSHPLATQLHIDYSQVRLGESVLFRIKGPVSDGQYKISVVDTRGTEVWIEQKFPPQSAAHLPMIIRSLLDRSGKAREIWAGQAGGQAYKAWPQAGEEAPKEMKTEDASKLRVIGTEEDRTEVGGRAYVCTRVTSVVDRPGEKPLVVVDWCSTEVPFPLLYGEKTYGGLLRRVVGDLTLELLSVANNAKPELKISD